MAIICFTRDSEKPVEPAEWPSRVSKAMDTNYQVLKRTGHQTTVKTNLSPFGSVCLRELRYSAKRCLLSPFRKDRGMNLWQYQKEMCQGCIPIAKPLLFLAICKGPFVIRSFLATEWLEGENLGELALSLDNGQLYASAYAGVASVIQLHNAGYLHGDLKWSNFIISDSDPKTATLVDLDYVKKRDISLLQGKEFARFALSALEYGFSEAFVQQLIRCYFDGRRNRNSILKMSLGWTMLRKRRRYKGRRV